jgi:hypothetical protein
MAERRSLQGLGWGLNAAVPDTAAAAWGARLIFPDDLLHDRQDITGEGEERTALVTWLNGGALRSALTEARRLADGYELTGSEERQVTLLDDEHGTIVANPRASHGYLYVAAWLHVRAEQ